MVLTDISAFKKTHRPVYLALGNFDGVHYGHQQLLANVAKKAHECHGIATALIFDPHPAYILQPDRVPQMLTTFPEKALLFKRQGMDVLIKCDFTHEIAQWSALEFVKKILIDAIAVSEVFIGFNYSFGHKGLGTSKTMEDCGIRFNFGVNIQPPVLINGEIVSSTLVRRYLQCGDYRAANILLGRRYIPEDKIAINI